MPHLRVPTPPLSIQCGLSEGFRHPHILLSFCYFRNMSGFLSSEAEMALLGEEEEAQRLFHQAMMEEQEQARGLYHQGERILDASTCILLWLVNLVKDDWSLHRRSPASLFINIDWIMLNLESAGSEGHYPPASRSDIPYINQTPALSTMNPSTMAAYSQMQPTPVLPSSPDDLPSSPQSSAWPNQSWSALHPEGYQSTRARATSGSDISRSSSPNPAELHSFGHLLADGYVENLFFDASGRWNLLITIAL